MNVLFYQTKYAVRDSNLKATDSPSHDSPSHNSPSHAKNPSTSNVKVSKSLPNKIQHTQSNPSITIMIITTQSRNHLYQDNTTTNTQPSVSI